jgi:hypothetical protein
MRQAGSRRNTLRATRPRCPRRARRARPRRRASRDATRRDALPDRNGPDDARAATRPGETHCPTVTAPTTREPRRDPARRTARPKAVLPFQQAKRYLTYHNLPYFMSCCCAAAAGQLHRAGRRRMAARASMTSWGAFTSGLGATFGEAVVRSDAGKNFILAGFGGAFVSGGWGGSARAARGAARRGARGRKEGRRKGGRKREGARTAGAGAEGTARAVGCRALVLTVYCCRAFARAAHDRGDLVQRPRVGQVRLGLRAQVHRQVQEGQPREPQGF